MIDRVKINKLRLKKTVPYRPLRKKLIETSKNSTFLFFILFLEKYESNKKWRQF